jgi:hypothetical protein
MTYVSQMSLITAILTELDRQEPGTLISQAQMNAIILAADQVVLAMRKVRPVTANLLEGTFSPEPSERGGQ